MKITINIKAAGCRYGTVGWLKAQLESGEIVLKESNNYFIPEWSSCPAAGWRVRTHGLVISDQKGENSALIAYRTMDGEYRYNVSAALSCHDGHWALALTDAATESLKNICEKWIETQEKDDNATEITLTVKIKGD